MVCSWPDIYVNEHFLGGLGAGMLWNGMVTFGGQLEGKGQQITGCNGVAKGL